MDSILVPPLNRMEAFDVGASPLGIDWRPDTIHVVPFVPEPIEDTLFFFVFSPAHMVITAPNGDSIGVDSATGVIFNTILNGSTYDTNVISPEDPSMDSDSDDVVTILQPLTGPYNVHIFRAPGSGDEDKFTAAIRINGNQLDIPESYNNIECARLTSGEVPSDTVWTATETLAGDVNADGNFTAADIIYLVLHSFKGGPPPVIPLHGDVNCDEVITAADIIVMVNFVFKSGPPPCSQTAG
jgi:hypothetical protein